MIQLLRHSLGIFCFLFISFLFAQQPTDCINSVIVCGNSSINLDVSGIGTQELSGSNNCASQENNSVWLKVTVVTSGTLGFTLTPQSSSIVEDYDFFVFGPNSNCSNLGQAIRCSTTNPQAANQGNNLTGMNASSTDTSEGPGPDGNSFVRWLNVSAGDSYFIVIDRPIGNSPFSLQWTGSARFADPPNNEAPTGTALNLETCDQIAPFTDGFTEFDLSVNTPTIIGSQANVAVSYHESESDANIGIRPIGTRGPYTNTTNPQNIYARITNSITGCFEIVPFELNILLSAHFARPSDFISCDNSNDGDNTNGQVIFDLSTKNEEILDGQNPVNVQVTYHSSLADAEDGSRPLPNLYYNTTRDFEQIYVRIEDLINTECQSSVTTLNLIVNPLPQAFNNTIIQCDEDGTVDGRTLFNLDEAHEALVGGNTNRSTFFYQNFVDAQINNTSNALDAIGFNNSINPQTIYVAVVDDLTGCHSTAELILDVSLTDSGNAQLVACDDDGTEDGFYTFNLNNADSDITLGLPTGLSIAYFRTYEDALLEQEDLGNTFTNTIPFNQTIFARVENANNCYGISEVELIVHELPNIIIENSAFYCLNTFPETIPINAALIDDLPENYTYNWSTGEATYEIQINEAGNYQVTVTNANNCSKTRTVNIEPSNIATFESINIVDASQNNTITVLVSGEGTYQYALYDENNQQISPFQSSNVFENVFPGLYNVWVKDIKNDCGIVEDLVSVIGFPKYFTPNNDGHHDTWQIHGVSEVFQPNSKILIFNRFGKLLKEISPTSKGWDGTSNGKPLPNDDYWFAVTLQDGRVFKNHFSLKR